MVLITLLPPLHFFLQTSYGSLWSHHPPPREPSIILPKFPPPTPPKGILICARSVISQTNRLYCNWIIKTEKFHRKFNEENQGVITCNLSSFNVFTTQMFINLDSLDLIYRHKNFKPFSSILSPPPPPPIFFFGFTRRRTKSSLSPDKIRLFLEGGNQRSVNC